MLVLFAHVRTGQWATILPAKLAETLGLTDNVRAIPIVEPAAAHAVGLVVPDRVPSTPLITALVTEAKRLAQTFERAHSSSQAVMAGGPRSEEPARKGKNPDRTI